ncbi:MAG TPA: hypothetical protein DCY13_15730 [Verrucomicrobiales bacterium]|nr:hypothetical protein [Verrucomicrobiales bacterium]
MQIQGECIVRNNLVIGAGGSAFASQPHQGSPTRLTVVHNTFINTGMAVRLSSWAAGTDMVFANNACYSRTGAALHVLNGITGTTLAGNVSYGTLPAGIAGFQPGTGLADFVNVSWDGVQRDARPAATSPLRGAGSAAHAAAVDVLFLPRIAPHTTGCHGP